MTEPTLYEIQSEIAKAVIQLAQEVHALNPGIFYDFDLSLIAAAIRPVPEPTHRPQLGKER